MRSEQSFRSAVRRVLSKAARIHPALESGSSLEHMGGEADPPKFIDAQVVEGATLCAITVPGPPEPRFAAFLDGTQRSVVIAWDGACPIVGGRVAAAIRARAGKRLVSWGQPELHWRIYSAFSVTPRQPWLAAFAGDDLVDLTDQADGGSAHPIQLLERARAAVNSDRERLERRLARRWCESEDKPLYVDGGISGEEAIASSTRVVGVVKNHRTLYVERGALETVVRLRRGERSSAFRIAPRGRSSVLSWYLRLRDPSGRGALWGLVRIEVAETQRVTERADEVSRWVLAETVPLALPDPRWDTMAYGVRGCEDFLRAIG